MTTNRMLVVGLLLMTALAAGALWWTSPSPSVTTQTSHATRYEPSVPQAGAPPPAKAWAPPQLSYEAYDSALGPLPMSLRGTQIPFHFQVDEHGRLTVTAALRDFFDYFLKTEGEEPNDIIHARLRELLNTHLPVPARERALSILEQYLALKQQEIELSKRWAEDYQASGREPDLTERLRLLRELRASLLDSETYLAFYGAEDQRDDYALKAREMLADDSLSPDARDAALSTLEMDLPAEERAVRQQQRTIEQLNARVTEARAMGATEAEIFRLREAVYGADAAQRFATADQQQAQWHDRIAAYRAQRKQILESTGMSDGDKQAQIQALQTQHFNALEQKRIPVIDSMMDQKGE